MSEAQKDAAMARLALDRPWPQQYLVWAKNFLSGDLGISFIYKQPVADLISNLWVNTVLLGGFAFLLTFGLATGLAAFCA
ncbi:MAG: ABC transporter permease, partial [Propionibacteriaceae bacterium]|nr:ABC transporter permease [Propionibacteriaceae bacterium]